MPPIQGMSFIHFYDTHPSNHSVHTPIEGQEEREETKDVEATKGTRTRHVRSGQSHIHNTCTQCQHGYQTNQSNKPINHHKISTKGKRHNPRTCRDSSCCCRRTRRSSRVSGRYFPSTFLGCVLFCLERPMILASELKKTMSH